MSDSSHNSGISTTAGSGSTITTGDITQVINHLANNTGKPHCPSAPLPPEHFTGRGNEIQALTDRLDSDQVVAITAVQGMGGVGKTSLAKALCAQKRDRFGAVLWADVTPSPNTRAILDNWYSYAVTDKKLPADWPLEQIADQVRGQLTIAFQELACKGRVLVVLDDLWDNRECLDAVTILQRAAPQGSKILITTRNEQIARDLNGKLIPLDELPDDDAKKLVTTLTADSLLIGPDFIDILIEVIGGHPLALEIASASLNAAADKDDLKGILTAYRLGMKDGSPFAAYHPNAPRNLSVVFERSYTHLTADQQRAFRWLGILAPESAWDRTFTGGLWEIDDSIVLADHHRALQGRALIHRDRALSTDETAWYGQHPLLRRYALGLLEANGERAAAFDRYTAMMTAFADQFRKLPPENWGQLSPYLPHVREVGDRLVQTYPAKNPDEAVMRRALQFALNTYGYVHRRPEERRGSWVELGLKAARGLGDRKREGLFLAQLGLIADGLGVKAQALDYYEQALKIYRELGDQEGEATTLTNIGAVYSALGDKARALTYYEQALPSFRAVGDRGGEAATLTNIGAVYSALGDKARALTYFEQALPSFRAVGDRGGEATTL
ncbi:MAG: NB-ARC domain-containing protein, partial [Anaerolineae bacterium]|nr:NB-ARC domain-containing protein [Anaerolineae bacterium]